MSKVDDGGPAFPHVYEAFGVTGVKTYAPRGMSIRDFFAAAALQGMLADSTVIGTADEIARLVYRLADAMLAARAKAESEGA